MCAVSRRSRLDLAGAEDVSDRNEALVRMLYREFGGALFGHVLHLTGNDRQWAEDVVQETLVRAWRNADRLDREPGMLRAWLYTVARRIVIDGRRSHSARPREVDAAPLEAMPIPDGSEKSLSAMVVAEALQGLSPEHREALAETYLRDRTVNEAAAVLGVPPGTVKSRVYYALRALRQQLRDGE
ncbi:sigma-70 family RNA polymerase sigma factor [Actinophytocola xanthii]|jgi:RNA polymerase sigma-70 factor, ECF subfamily|uniref:RNA polymerase sigma factor n=1 Tax=Actinophytocola xanthii TaxID=1912961 RepID=A0A1Q8CDY5_9PSEU|nr:RNA polymerase subunit sigma [Actinophytocola xanthii]